MSNPIADTAEYFSDQELKKKHNINSKPNLRIFPSQNLTSAPEDLLSPESPESRRPQIKQQNEFDPKLQWQRVLKRLPINHHYEDSNSSSSSSSSDVSDNEQPNSYEMQAKKPYFNEEDNNLPDADDIEERNDERLNTDDDNIKRNDNDDDKNFFQHPFDEQQQTQPQQDIVSPEDPSSTTSMFPTVDAAAAEQEQKEKGKARKHWGTTLDKVRLIANLHTLPRHSKQNTQMTSSLAPYYPPLFDPVFIALSKDNHGHRWPPVLLPLLNVAITDSQLVTKGINQWVFRIELQYGEIKWVINRTIADFLNLHYTLKVKSNISDSVPSPPNFPSQLESWFNSAKGTIQRDTVEFKDEKHTVALKRRKALTKYLRTLLMKAHTMATDDICEFLEISAVSIAEDMGWKGKEGFLENKVNFVIPRLCHVIRPHLWNKKWVILRDSYIAFIHDTTTTQVEDVFLFDKSLQVSNNTLGVFGKYHHHITMENKFRRIEMKGSRREIEEWKTSIQRVLKNSPWIKNHRFGSFAPVRHQAKMRWFVDAEDHFNAVAEAILSAKSEIYIADWWLSPELYLRRPPAENEDFRLDRLLQRKAQEGVKIYIIVYKEMAVALTINSAHTKLWLQNLHQNIIVVRHPDHRSIDNNVLFWSHHEKIVVVDNRLAFIGGLDLCWGRYDTKSHQLTDYPAQGRPQETFPGQDYNNPRVKDFQNVAQYDVTLVNRETTARMPWHDMTVGMVGPIARDVARHFIQRWNFLKASKGMHRPTVPFLMPKGEYVAARDESAFKGSCRVQLLRSSAQWSSGIEREHSIYNTYMECISKSKHFIYIENQFFISTTVEDKLLRNKIAQAMVERIKRAHKKGEKFKIIILIPLIPAFEGDLATKDAAAARNVMHFQYITISRGGQSIQEKLIEEGIDPDEYITWYSLRNWDKLLPPSTPATDDDREHYISELVYIHDKIMIVDDRLVLIGSANINDRSQLGNRDSEVAMLIEDTEFVPSYMNGKPYKAAKFAHTLRMHLFKEHLGLLQFNDWKKLVDDPRAPTDFDDRQHQPHRSTQEEIKDLEDARPDTILNHEKRSQSPTEEERFDTTKERYDAMCLDPLTDHFYKEIWGARARENTLIYRDLFRCVPDDTVHTFEQHRQFLPEVPHGHVADPDLHGKDIQKRLDGVRGHLVQFPTQYLKDENMLGSLIRETVTPMIIFT